VSCQLKTDMKTRDDSSACKGEKLFSTQERITNNGQTSKTRRQVFLAAR